MKKSLVFALPFFFLCVCACAQNAEYKKIDSVLSKMSQRAQNEIKIPENKKEEFLKDLHFVLAEEKKYASDDIPLYTLIDKKHPVQKSYEPTHLVNLDGSTLFNVNKKGLSLRSEAKDSLDNMAKAAQNDGIKLLVSSTYRSYAYQEKLFNYWVYIDGLEEAERESARPGTSQHQLGTAVDFGSISDDFAETQMGKWVYFNADKFGWSLSFPKEYEDITGYRWECWHFRYIGVPACRFQQRWFLGVQQYMLEFIDLWKKEN